MATHRRSKSSENSGPLLKLVMMGNSAVGKSNMVSRFIKDEFNPSSAATAGIEFATQAVVMPSGLSVRVQIWDTAGQERFQSLTAAYYRGAVGGLLLFDITSRASFTAIGHWYEQVIEHAHERFSAVVVGNKVDLVDGCGGGGEGPSAAGAAAETGGPAEANALESAEAEGAVEMGVASGDGGGAVGGNAARMERVERAVSNQEARAWAAERGLQYFEVSCAQGTNVHESFMCILQQVEKLLPPKPPATSSPAKLPAGWTAVESSARPGEITYENQYTKERVATLPTKAAQPAHGSSVCIDVDDGATSLVPSGDGKTAAKWRCGNLCAVQ